MDPETSEQIRVFRSVIAAERASIEDLERRFEHHTMKRMAQRAMADLDDVEMFLKPMEAQGRTLLEDTLAIRSAHVPYQWAIMKRKQLEGAINTYGTGAMLIPDPFKE
jgi:hypothetical protein